jgi:Kef-type K+ transport system membrane component KefB/nucleotide-binding universal stress UspA family protein
MALILAAARLFSEICKRFNQPPVLGELLAGIVLGPSLLGATSPELFNAVFAKRDALESMSTMGLILLMLLTGLETDIRILRNMGRAAFTASVFGMLVPFAAGVGLGIVLDERFVLADNKDRLPLAMFLATAMAVSAMPVIAKILMDLNMMRRNFGIVSLSAAIVDDTIGWILLAVISGILTSGEFNVAQLVNTFALLTVFIVFARYVLFPALSWMLPRVEHEMRVPGGELTIIIIITLLCAAATEAMHVHAVFGAFVAGMVFRQCPTLNAENLHRLEGITLALFAPLFFGAVGLRVDLRTLTDWRLALGVLAIAVAAKVIGCYLGGIFGRMPKWEALAVGLCMSARGAVGLVVAKIGLDLGVINSELFSILVMMAIVTSFLAPLMLRAIVHKLPLSEEEKLREKGTVKGFVPAGQLKILIPTAGGENSVIGTHLATHICRSDGDRCTALYVDAAPRIWWKRIFGGKQRDINADQYSARLRSAAAQFAQKLTFRRKNESGTILDTILDEAAKGYHFVFLGASGHRHPLYDPFVSELVKRSPANVVLVSGAKAETGSNGGSDTPPTAENKATPQFKRILVPTNGSYYSDAAFDLAAHYAGSTQASISVLYVAERRQRNPLLPNAAEGALSEPMQELMRVTLKEQFGERLTDPQRMDCKIRESESVISGLVEEVQSGNYDLVVLGAENKSFVERLYLGQHIEAAITEVSTAIAIVIPKVQLRR